MNVHRLAGVFLCASLLLFATACGGEKIAGTATFYKGVSGSGRMSSPRKQKHLDGARAGTWYFTPNKLTMKIVAVSFDDESVTVDCSVTYEKGAASLAKLLECPVSAPAGTYSRLGITVSNDINVTISDSTNGVFTTTSSATLLTTSEPSGGAQEVTINTCISCAAHDVSVYTSNFPEPFTIDAANPPAISVVFDPVQWLSSQSTDGTFGSTPPTSTNVSFPLIPALGQLSKVEYYNNVGTLDSHVMTDSSVGFKVFYSTDTTPVRLDMSFGRTAFTGCPTQFTGSAWNASHKTATAGTSTNPLDKYFGSGGYLGLDSNGKISWAMATEFDYATWAGVFSMPEKTTIGETTSLSYLCTTSVPDPTSGNTYASGAPTFTSSTPITLTLVGK